MINADVGDTVQKVQRQPSLRGQRRACGPGRPGRPSASCCRARPAPSSRRPGDRGRGLWPRVSCGAARRAGGLAPAARAMRQGPARARPLPGPRTYRGPVLPHQPAVVAEERQDADEEHGGHEEQEEHVELGARVRQLVLRGEERRGSRGRPARVGPLRASRPAPRTTLRGGKQAPPRGSLTHIGGR